MKRALLVSTAAALAASLPGCSVEFLADAEDNAITNVCKVDSDCGPDGACTSGACFAKGGVIDEVLLEVVPDSNSFSGGLSFLSVVSGIRQGSRQQNVVLPARNHFVTQVLAELPADCDAAKTMPGKPPIQARIEFARTGAVGGVPIFGLSTVPLIVDTMLSSGSWNAPVALVPGTYDVYIQPGPQNVCELAPRILRGVEVPAHIVTDQGWAPPATFELPKPATLQGKVTRGTSGTLAGWQVDLIDPQQGRVISTTARLGASPTNFAIAYQPLAGNPAANAPATNSPIIRISPPAAMANEAPTVYWDLAAADLTGTGQCNLDLSELRDRDALVTVSGQVHGELNDPGVLANVQFHSLSLDGAPGLTAAFKQSITSDDHGNYRTRLFPGEYRVVVIPVNTDMSIVPPSSTQGVPMPTGAATRPWAIAEEQWTITTEPNQTLGFVLPHKRIVAGSAYAGTEGMVPALGATLEAIPTILPGQVGPLKGALALAPTVPQNASVSVDDNGKFALRLDPGDFDLSLRTPESSNFAWWVWPGAHVTKAEALGDTIPIQVARLPYPVPLEGAITAPDVMGDMLPLRGAAVRAYARVPMGPGVTKVGDARTDDMGRYRLRLPPSFGP